MMTLQLKNVFSSFVPITDLSGKNLASTIITKLSHFGINVSKMRGQGYDAAAAMSGKLNSAQAHIREIIPTALYVHCAAHSFNLAVSNSCDLRQFEIAWEQSHRFTTFSMLLNDKTFYEAQ